VAEDVPRFLRGDTRSACATTFCRSLRYPILFTTYACPLVLRALPVVPPSGFWLHLQAVFFICGRWALTGLFNGRGVLIRPEQLGASTWRLADGVG